MKALLLLLLLVLTLSTASLRRANKRRRTESIGQIFNEVWQEAGASNQLANAVASTCIKVTSDATRSKSSKARRLSKSSKASKSTKSGIPYCDGEGNGTSDLDPIDCEAIAQGLGQTEGANSTIIVAGFEIEVAAGANVTAILEEIVRRLQTIFGPSFAGCDAISSGNRMKHRYLQLDAQITNVVFGAPQTVQQELCGTNTCAYFITGSTIYFFGNQPGGLLAAIQDAINNGLFDGIDGLLSIGVSDGLGGDGTGGSGGDGSGGSGGDGSGGDGSGSGGSGGDGSGGSGGDGTGGSGGDGSGSGGDGTGSGGDGSGSGGDGSGSGGDGSGSGGDGSGSGGDGGGDGPNGIVTPRSIGDDGLGAGAAVAIAGGSLLLCLLCMFILGKQGRVGVSDDDSDFSNVQSAVKHRQLTEDEDEVPPGEEPDIEVKRVRSSEAQTRALYTDDPKVAHIVGENDSSYMGATFGYQTPEDSGLPSDEELFEQHGPNETCSSPSCIMCEARRQQGPSFIRSTRSQGSEDTSDPSRQYAMADTVQL